MSIVGDTTTAAKAKRTATAEVDTTMPTYNDNDDKTSASASLPDDHINTLTTPHPSPSMYYPTIIKHPVTLNSTHFPCALDNLSIFTYIILICVLSFLLFALVLTVVVFFCKYYMSRNEYSPTALQLETLTDTFSETQETSFNGSTDTYINSNLNSNLNEQSDEVQAVYESLPEIH